MDTADNVAMVLSGIGGSIGVIYSLVTERRYRKAKKVLDEVKACDIDTIQDATKTAIIKPYKGFVSGRVMALDKNKVVYSEARPRVLTLWGLSAEENIWSGLISGSKFALREDSHEIYASPSQKTKSFGLPHEMKTHAPLVLGLQALFFMTGNILSPQINLGTSEYAAYDGQNITLFGLISYNSAKGILEMPKVRYLFSGAKKDVERHLGNIAGSEWWKATIGEAITLGLLGVAAYYAGKKIKEWYSRKRDDKFKKLIQEKMSKLNVAADGHGDFRCTICYDRVKNVIYRNCNHLATCHECDSSLKEQKCPICRSPIVSKTFISLE